MKKWLTIVGMMLCGFVSTSHALSQGKLGLNYTVGPSFIVGDSRPNDAGSVQPGVGAALHYGVLPNVEATFAYDYLHANLHSQALTFGGQLRIPTSMTVSPFVGAGIGFGKPYAGEGWDHFSMKITGGLEKPFTDSLSLAAVMSYQFIDGSDPIGTVHSLWPGLRVNYSF